MSIATADKVRALSRDFGSQRRLAELLDVNPSQITRWSRGDGPDPENADRVDLLELVMAHLLRQYAPRAAELWLTGLNPLLNDRRPIDVIQHGRPEELLGVLRQEDAGSFA